MRKRFIFAFVLLILLSTYNLQNHYSISSKFYIKKIIVENNFILKEEDIIQNLLFLYKTNLFFLGEKKLKHQINKMDFVESFKIKKIFPNTIKIEIYEKKPIAILQKKERRYYYTDKDEIVDFKTLENYKNLPVIFGNEKDFKTLYTNLKKTNFPIKTIEKFFLYKSKRWDLLTTNNITIKLPINEYNESLNNFIKITKNKNLNKYKTFDYRINGQLILN